MGYLKGTQLTPKDQQKVLASFNRRYTRQYVPEWVKAGKTAKGYKFPLQFNSDADWLEHTEFRVSLAGNLDGRSKFCMSYPTWPDNPELRRRSKRETVVKTH